jgi:hypothetical protein
LQHFDPQGLLKLVFSKSLPSSVGALFITLARHDDLGMALGVDGCDSPQTDAEAFEALLCLKRPGFCGGSFL